MHLMGHAGAADHPAVGHISCALEYQMNLLNQTASLVAFVRVVESGSFSAAARMVGMTPSAVSKGIARLEAELGATLFRRSTRQLSLTSEGQAFFERVAPLLRGLEDSADAIRAAGDARGLLRASLPSELGRLLMPSIASDFLAHHETLSLELSLSDRHVDVIREGYDVVFRVGNVQDSDLRARRLALLEMALVASPALLARLGQPTSLERCARCRSRVICCMAGCCRSPSRTAPRSNRAGASRWIPARVCVPPRCRAWAWRT